MWAEYAQNSLCSSATGLTPLKCVFRHRPPLCPWNTTHTDVQSVDKWLKGVERVWEGAHTNISRAMSRFTKQANRHHREAPAYHVKDWVWLCNRDLHLSSWYIGPFVITDQINLVSFKLQLQSNLGVSPVFHVSLFRPVVLGPLQDKGAKLMPPSLVCRLLDSRLCVDNCST